MKSLNRLHTCTQVALPGLFSYRLFYTSIIIQYTLDMFGVNALSGEGKLSILFCCHSLKCVVLKEEIFSLLEVIFPLSVNHVFEELSVQVI